MAGSHLPIWDIVCGLLQDQSLLDAEVAHTKQDPQSTFLTHGKGRQPNPT